MADTKLSESGNSSTNEHRTDVEWITVRDARTKRAIEDEDLDELRKVSALPGGFGSEAMRKKAWSALLCTNRLVVDNKPKDEKVPLTESSDDGQQEPQSASEGSDEKHFHLEAGPSVPLPHPNERQVKLDTDRSFVTYPRGIPKQIKLELQADLNDLIVGVLRKYPALSYFQGYHDILSVLYLTFIPPKPVPQRSRSSSRTRIRTTRSGQRTPESLSVPPPAIETEKELIDEAKVDEKLSTVQADVEDSVEREKQDVAEDSPPPYYEDRDTEDWRELRRCAEMLSLNRVRDAMGSGMEGMMGLLRILKRILRAADPELSQFSAQISPVPTLPFFALSWVLTLFSHDCDSLQPVQRMFDFLLARNPISAVYLAAAILISKKPQMLRLAQDLGEEYQEDPTLLHPLFVRLPPLYADTPSEPEPPAATTPSKLRLREFDDDDPNPYQAIKLSELFLLTDTLMKKYPWDGNVIRGTEIMGEGSTVSSYSSESGDWTPEKALEMVDVQVVMPGAGTAVDDEEEEQPDISPARPSERKRKSALRLPRNKIRTLVAFGVVVLGVGIAVYGVRAGGNEASWGRWWGYVIRGWAGREGRKLGAEIGGVAGYVRKALRDVL